MQLSAREHYTLELARRPKAHNLGNHGVDLTAHYEQRLALMLADSKDDEGAARHMREVRLRTFTLG